jgi:ankyrin repeat protein
MKNIFFFFILLTSAYILPSHASTEKPPARSLPIKIASKETIEKYFNELKNLNESTIIIKNPIIDDCLDLDIEIEDLLLNKNLKDYLNFKLIHAIKTLDFNNVALALKHQADPNHVFEIYYFDIHKITDIFDEDYTPLQCALQLKNLNEEQEVIRRSIIIELLQYGANPFVQEQKENKDDHIYKYNKIYLKKLYNLFSLENIANNPDLALFLVKAGQKYAKEEYFQQFRQDFQATFFLMSRKDIDLLDPLIFMFLYGDDVYIKGNFLMTRLNIPQDYSFLKNTDLKTLINEYPLLKLFKKYKKYLKTYPNFEKDLPNLIEFFIQAGMNVNYQDYHLNSILQEAIQNKPNSEIITKLLERGANPNLQNNKGENSLMTAIEWDKSNIIPILLQYDADPNLQDNQGQNSLIFAIKHYNFDAIPMLLESGANFLIKNKDNQNALDVINNEIKQRKRGQEYPKERFENYFKIKDLFLATEKKASQEELADELSHLIGKTLPERPQKNANNIFRARLAKMI